MKGGGVVEEEVGAVDPDLARGVEMEVDPGKGAADGRLRGGRVGEGYEAGLSGAVEFAEVGVRSKRGKGCAEGGVEFGATDKDQAEVGKRARPKDEA